MPGPFLEHILSIHKQLCLSCHCHCCLIIVIVIMLSLLNKNQFQFLWQLSHSLGLLSIKLHLFPHKATLYTYFILTIKIMYMQKGKLIHLYFYCLIWSPFFLVIMNKFSIHISNQFFTPKYIICLLYLQVIQNNMHGFRFSSLIRPSQVPPALFSIRASTLAFIENDSEHKMILSTPPSHTQRDQNKHKYF